MKTSRRRGVVFRFILGTLAIAACCLPAAGAYAGNYYYWDTNGTAAGAGDTPNGVWGTSNFWNTDSTGGANGTFATTTGSADFLYFVAASSGTSGENAYTVTVSGTQNADLLYFWSSGAPTLSGTGTINLWSGGITFQSSQAP